MIDNMMFRMLVGMLKPEQIDTVLDYLKEVLKSEKQKYTLLENEMEITIILFEREEKYYFTIATIDNENRIIRQLKK